MAVPFRRKSSKKSREGRSVENLKKSRNLFSKFINCENCREKKIMHKVCKKCFSYREWKL